MLAVVKEYCLHTSLHGLHFISEPGRHWTERLFWACCCLVSWIGSAVLMKSSYESFMTSPIKFVVEAGYWNWQTNFPSITVCQTDHKKKFRNISKQLTGDRYKLEDVYRTIVYFRSDASAIKNMCLDVNGDWDKDAHCPLNNLSSLSNMLRGSCEEVFTWCYWNHRRFNCCDEFQPLDTEFGTCYSINNYNTLQKPGAMSLLTNRSIKQPNMTLRFAVPVQVFLHSEVEVPSWNLLDNEFKLSSGKTNRVLFTVKEIENEPGVRDVKPQLRNCRFPDENPLEMYRYYSQNGCLVECRRDLQLRLCNCSHHLTPGTNLVKECDGFGMLCLNKYRQELSNEISPWEARDKDFLLCHCLPSCHAMEVDSIPSRGGVKLPHKGTAELIMSSLPTARFKRRVLRGKLDLVVDLGGAVSLLIGASLLSFVELIYYMTLRPAYRQNECGEVVFRRAGRRYWRQERRLWFSHQ